MSLSDAHRGESIEKLTSDNYLIWSEKVKDYILALDCEDAEDIWEAFFSDPLRFMRGFVLETPKAMSYAPMSGRMYLMLAMLFVIVNDQSLPPS